MAKKTKTSAKKKAKGTTSKSAGRSTPAKAQSPPKSKSGKKGKTKPTKVTSKKATKPARKSEHKSTKGSGVRKSQRAKTASSRSPSSGKTDKTVGKKPSEKAAAATKPKVKKSATAAKSKGGRKRKAATKAIKPTEPLTADLAAEPQDEAELAEQLAAVRAALSQGDDLLHILEALLFAAHEPLPARRIAQALGKVRTDRVLLALDDLEGVLEERRSPLQLVEMAGGFRLVTRPEFAPYLARLFHKAEKERMSPAALETLAIVAYRQPVTRGDIEGIRGVQASPVLKALQERKLIKVVGRANVVGRPQQYGTTKKFLDVFGLPSLKDLPAAFGPDREEFGAKPQEPDPANQVETGQVDSDEVGQEPAKVLVATADESAEEAEVVSEVEGLDSEPSAAADEESQRTTPSAGDDPDAENHENKLSAASEPDPDIALVNDQPLSGDEELGSSESKESNLGSAPDNEVTLLSAAKTPELDS